MIPIFNFYFTDYKDVVYQISLRSDHKYRFSNIFISNYKCQEGPPPPFLLTFMREREVLMGGRHRNFKFCFIARRVSRCFIYFFFHQYRIINKEFQIYPVTTMHVTEGGGNGRKSYPKFRFFFW